MTIMGMTGSWNPEGAPEWRGARPHQSPASCDRVLGVIALIGATLRQRDWWWFGILGLVMATALGWMSAASMHAWAIAVLLVCGMLVLGAAWAAPYTTTAAALCLAVAAPAYLQLKLVGFPLAFNGPLLLGIAMALCGLRVTLLARPGQRTSRSSVSVAPWVFAAAWFIGSALSTIAWVQNPAAYAIQQSFVPVAALVGAYLVARTAEGRRSTLIGLCSGSVLASAMAIVEFATGKNVFVTVARSAGVVNRIGAGVSPDSLLERMGFVRAEGAFTHPLMLGVFIALGLLATLEVSALVRRLHPLVFVAIVVQLAGLLATGSRGPIVLGAVFVLLWLTFSARLSRSLPLLLLSLVAVLFVVAFANIGVGPVQFLGLRGGSGALAVNTEYRAGLLVALPNAIRHASAFGYSNAVQAGLFPGFQSLDNQIAWLLATRGFVGALAWLGLLVLPVGLAVTARGMRVPGKAYVILCPVLILLLGLGVAFFDLAAVYVFVVVGLCLGSLQFGADGIGSGSRDVGAPGRGIR
jgi:hypothetical protein